MVVLAARWGGWPYRAYRGAAMSGFFQVDLGVLQQMTTTLRDAGNQMDDDSIMGRTGRMVAAATPKGAK